MRWHPLLLTAAVVLGVGCGDSTGPSPTPIAEIRITPVFSPLPVGYRVRLLATPFDLEGNVVENCVFAWRTSSPGVARVLANGAVTGVSPGEVEIGAECSGVESSTSLEVVDAPSPVAGPEFQWTTEATADPVGTLVPRAMWGSSPEELVAVGDWWLGADYFFDIVPAIFRRDAGTGWVRMDPGPEGQLVGVWGTSASDLFTVGVEGVINHYDGTAWAQMPSGTGHSLAGVWGSSGEDVFAVGASGVVVHYDGAGWSRAWVDPRSKTLLDIWGSAGSDVFAVGTSVAVHYDGSAWTRTAFSGVTLMGVWGTSGTNVFAVGDAGTILHYDGTEWSAVPAPIADDLVGIQGTGENDIFAVGHERVLHYDGTLWRPVQSPAPEEWDEWNGLWVGPQDLFLAGWPFAHGTR